MEIRRVWKQRIPATQPRLYVEQHQRRPTKIRNEAIQTQQKPEEATDIFVLY